MSDVLAIGGTRFIGRATVEEFLNHGYEVTLFNRGNHPNPFASDDRVAHIAGDRTNADALEEAHDAVSPDIVVDCVAYSPDEVETALDMFDSVDAYVFVSSVAAYVDDPVVKYEGETALKPCTPAQAVDDSWETYGERKAEADRIILDAADRGIPAMTVRPSMVYGPHDYNGTLDYWIGRVREYERLVVPGDGSYIGHRTFVEDVGAAMRLIAEKGAPGAYNVADRQPQSINQMVETIAAVLDTDCEIVHAADQDLAAHGLDRSDFPYHRRRDPFILSTDKLRRLGWEPTTNEDAIGRTCAHLDGQEINSTRGPSREEVDALLASLSPV